MVTSNNQNPIEKVVSKYLSRFEHRFKDKDYFTTDDIVQPIEEYYRETGRVVPVELLLAQMQAEGAFNPTDGGRSKINNPMNIGEYDDKTVATFDSTKEGISAYVRILDRDYLNQGEIKVDTLLQNFVNKDGNRYASDESYEQKVSSTIDAIKSYVGESLFEDYIENPFSNLNIEDDKIDYRIKPEPVDNTNVNLKKIIKKELTDGGVFKGTVKLKSDSVNIENINPNFTNFFNYLQQNGAPEIEITSGFRNDKSTHSSGNSIDFRIKSGVPGSTLLDQYIENNNLNGKNDVFGNDKSHQQFNDFIRSSSDIYKFIKQNESDISNLGFKLVEDPTHKSTVTGKFTTPHWHLKYTGVNDNVNDNIEVKGQNLQVSGDVNSDVNSDVIEQIPEYNNSVIDNSFSFNSDYSKIQSLEPINGEELSTVNLNIDNSNINEFLSEVSPVSVNQNNSPEEFNSPNLQKIKDRNNKINFIKDMLLSRDNS